MSWCFRTPPQKDNADLENSGGHNWFIGDAPFVGGIGGFASVFVTAAFACKRTILSADLCL